MVGVAATLEVPLPSGESAPIHREGVRRPVGWGPNTGLSDLREVNAIVAKPREPLGSLTPPPPSPKTKYQMLRGDRTSNMEEQRVVTGLRLGPDRTSVCGHAQVELDTHGGTEKGSMPTETSRRRSRSRRPPTGAAVIRHRKGSRAFLAGTCTGTGCPQGAGRGPPCRRGSWRCGFTAASSGHPLPTCAASLAARPPGD